MQSVTSTLQASVDAVSSSKMAMEAPQQQQMIYERVENLTCSMADRFCSFVGVQRVYQEHVSSLVDCISTNEPDEDSKSAIACRALVCSEGESSRNRPSHGPFCSPPPPCFILSARSSATLLFDSVLFAALRSRRVFEPASNCIAKEGRERCRSRYTSNTHRQ